MQYQQQYKNNHDHHQVTIYIDTLNMSNHKVAL